MSLLAKGDNTLLFYKLSEFPIKNFILNTLNYADLCDECVKHAASRSERKEKEMSI